MIFAHGSVFTREELGASLSDDDVASSDNLSAKDLDA
jgi:hypothetical protein